MFESIKSRMLYMGVSIVIAYPILDGLYGLALDMGWGPSTALVPMASNAFPLSKGVASVSFVVGSSIAQKLIFIGIFFLTALGAHRLAQLAHILKVYPLATYAAGLLYVCNP
ncbi:MAG TPA: hypothetical protein VK983_02260, partial [Candidatus Limnocylindrales bacterium]|nr:hypothetical protein [Candidatus Limnocylindrales bacterium]